MSLSIGIVGLPNVGKSTLFNALTKADILAANYPFATIEPNTGVVSIPDDRLITLAGMYKAEKITPATIKFVDIAGLVTGASKGEGLGNKFLSHIREVSAIAMVVRAFSSTDIQHVEKSVHPKRDIDIVLTELALADLQTADRRLPTLEKESKSNPKLRPEFELMSKIKQALEDGRRPELDSQDKESLSIKSLGLLTLKPIIYVFNVDETDLTNQQRQQELSNLVAPSQALFINAQMEAELKDMPQNEQAELLASVGINEPGLHKLINAAYETLGLQSYLTAGPKEVRAWTITSGATAPEAAGIIHGDFQRGFIAADVVSYTDLIATGSLASAKAAGKVRTEGKTYVMRPDDVVEFKFNVSK